MWIPDSGRNQVEEQDEKHVKALQSLDIEYLPNINISATNKIDWKLISKRSVKSRSHKWTGRTC